MLTATEFIYDGIYSGTFGLRIASLNSNVIEETSYITPSIMVAKNPRSLSFHYLDTTLDSPPTMEFSILSASEIHEFILRDILLWLDSRKGFKPFIILQPGLDKLTHWCIFTVGNLVYHAGKCVGLNLTATFKSIYAEGKPNELKVKGNKNVVIMNNSDIIEDFVYPKVKFITTNGNLSITNLTEDSNRVFSFENLALNATYEVDNELKIIRGEGNNLLEKFSKKWLRLVKGKNKLAISIDGEVTISCPNYFKIRL